MRNKADRKILLTWLILSPLINGGQYYFVLINYDNRRVGQSFSSFSFFRSFPHSSRLFSIKFALFFINHNNVQTYLQYAFSGHVWHFSMLGLCIFSNFWGYLKTIFSSCLGISCQLMIEWMWNALIFFWSNIFLFWDCVCVL